MSQPGSKIYAFGDFRLDAGERALYRQNQLIALTPKAFDTLLALIRHAGHIVSKEDLMQQVWPSTFVEEGNLNVHIFALRKVLAEADGNQMYIETIPRRGYRFRAEVQELCERPSEPHIHLRAIHVAGDGQGLTSSEIQERAFVRPGEFASAAWAGRRLNARILALSALLVIAAVLAINYWPRPVQQVNGASNGRFLIGVLPFANLSGDAVQDYLADGFTEELITELGRLNPRQLGVIARTSMMPYRDTSKPVREIAKELGLRYVLEGGVVRVGPRLRVTVKLIQASDQSQLWASEYDRDFSDIIEVQSEVARAVARETFVHFTPETQRRQELSKAVSPQAYDAYLAGRVYWWMRTEAGYQRARAHFEEALRIDPNFARAYSGLADTSVVYGLRAGDPRVYARKAVELDDTLAEAHASLAMAVFTMDVDWVTAEAHFRRSLEIDPYYVTARHWYGFMLAYWGRETEAIEQLERAQETDPLNIVILTDLGRAFFFARQYDRAKEPLLKAVSLDPKFPWPHYWLGRIFEEQGQFQQAFSQYLLGDDRPLSVMNKDVATACLYAKMGQPQKTREILRRLENGPAILPSNRALIYVALGQKERACQILSEPPSKPPITSAHTVYAIADPGFASLRTDPCFQAAIAKVAPPTR
jgi:TolB-like protein/DNA-binding winged helix-turn-helix (wHTH) protein/Tfp pilus assembly protein PilF